MTHIFIDIETLPDMREGARDEFIQNAMDDVKVPSGYTKEQMASDLGITDKETIKFTSRDSMANQWCAEVGPSKAEEIGDMAWRKTGLDGTRGQICCVGVALNDEPPVVLNGEEYQVLSNLAILLVAAQSNRNLITFVGHNLTEFDLPFIYHRSVINGIAPAATFPIMPSRYDSQVFDTMHKWAGFGKYIKLDALAMALGVGSKGDMDGSQVYDYYKAGRINEIAEYCKNDVIMTRAVWRKMTFQEQ